MMTDIVRYTLMLLGAAAVAAFAGCSSKGGSRPVVTVSIDPQKWLLDSIVGDRVEVRSLLPGDANPENFDPPLAALKSASGGILYMKMGHLPWEDALAQRLKEGNGRLRVVDTSEGIDLIADSGHSHLHDDGDDHHDHAGTDPHTWTSVRNARVIASNMLDAMVEADPVNADEYRRRHAELDRGLARMDSAMSARLAPLRGQGFLVWHPSLSYFARDYGLTQIALGGGGKEISLPGLMERLRSVPAESGRRIVMFVQPQMDESGRSDAIVQATGARKAMFNPMAADWDKTMMQLVDNLTE